MGKAAVMGGLSIKGGQLAMIGKMERTLPMPAKVSRTRRAFKAFHRRAREFRMIVKGLASTDHPVQAQIIPMRRCNLSCAYCNEYDDVSKPVPVDEMFLRIDHLASLGTTIIVISGGEPLLHPELDEIIRRIRSHRMIAGMITNGYLLTPERIARLNRAGLEHLQISIDNVQPDEVSKKSLKVLDKKLQWLSEYAEFHVNINSVIGGGVNNPEDALIIGRRARQLGFTSTVGIIHDGDGQLRPLKPNEQQVYQAMKTLNRSSYSRLNKFQDNIALGKPNDWRCRSGSRYLYICEDGLVHWCSQQRGTPGVPLLQYTLQDIRREFLLEKHCAPNCTISCAHQTSYMDYWRAPQQKLIGLRKSRPELFAQPTANGRRPENLLSIASNPPSEAVEEATEANALR
jgi:MoaA/NifB/PqqE/SkfB family radical SAM enzyme